jgi:hypothetical protein
VDPSAYALVHGIRCTRGALASWRDRPWPVLRAWVGGSLSAALLLLLAIWVISLVASGHGAVAITRPPFVVGDRQDVLRILGRNMLVLALHAMACVAGFIAGSSLPLQARYRIGLMRAIHEGSRRFAIVFVVSATCFSLSWQAYALGSVVARVAATLDASSALLLIGLLPHAVPELVALFLPLAAWIVASRRGEWDQLLAATIVTVAFALPMLVITAVWEVYVTPHLLAAVLG